MQKKLLKNKRILILGGSLMQIPLIRCAQENGAIAVVMDKNRDALGAKMADFFLEASIGDVDQALNSALDFVFHHQKFDAVLTVGTDFSLTVAILAEKLHLPGTSVLAAECCTHKKKMRDTLRAAGLFQPLCLEVKASDFLAKKTKISSNNEENEEEIALIKDCATQKNALRDIVVKKWENLCREESNHLPVYPAVLKPVDSMGARGVIRVNNPSELKENLESTLSFSPSQCVIVEQFLTGEGKWFGELSIDALVFQKEIIITGVADRMIAHAPHFVEDGHILPSQRPKDVVLASIEVFKKAIKAVDLQHGAAKADIILTNDLPVMGEIAARLSGGFMSGYTFPLSSGINLMEKMLLVACGFSPHPFKEKSSKIVLEHALYARGTGIIKNISGIAAVAALEEVAHLFIHVQRGSKVENPKNNLMKCGNVIISAPDVDTAMRVAQNVGKMIHFELE